MKNSSNTEPGSPTIQPATAERTEPAEQAQAQLAAIVASSDDAILSQTLDGIITTWNGGAQRIFGYEAQVIIGQPILRLIPPELHDEEEQILTRIKAGQRVENYETERLTKDAVFPYPSRFHPSTTLRGTSSASRKSPETSPGANARKKRFVSLNAQLSADLSAVTRMQQISTRLAQAEYQISSTRFATLPVTSSAFNVVNGKCWMPMRTFTPSTRLSGWFGGRAHPPINHREFHGA